MDDEIDGPRHLVDVQDLVPGLAPVSGLEDAALRIVGPLVAAGGHPHRVRIGRMDDDPRDGLGLGEPHVGPGLACVGGLPDPGAGVGAAEDVGLARPDPDDVLVGGGQGQVPDGGGDVVLEDRRPGHALVVGLPHASGGAADVDGVGAASRLDHGHVGDPTTEVDGAQELPRQRPEEGAVLHGLVVGERRESLGGAHRSVLSEGDVRCHGSRRDEDGDSRKLGESLHVHGCAFRKGVCR